MTFDLLPCESNQASISLRHLRPLANDEDEPEFSHQQAQEEMEVEDQEMVPSESEWVHVIGISVHPSSSSWLDTRMIHPCPITQLFCN